VKYTTIFFDADNTLFDYDMAEGFALEQTFRRSGIPITTETRELYRRINAEAWKEFESGAITIGTLRTLRFRRLFERLGMDMDPIGVSTFYLERLGEGACLVKDALEVLKEAASVCTCCIVTNGIADVQRSRLSRSPLLPYVRGLIISEEVGSQKPEPGMFDAAMELCGGPDKGDVLMVGDSLSSDILGGIRYGIDTCWFNPRGEAPSDGITPTMEIGALSGLLPVIGVPRTAGQ